MSNNEPNGRRKPARTPHWQPPRPTCRPSVASRPSRRRRRWWRRRRWRWCCARGACCGGGGGAAAGGGGTSPLDDVFTTYKFWIEIESDLVAGFTEASGIQAEAEIFEWLEGGENTSVLKFPGRAKYGNITLKHGFTMSEKLWNSFKKTLQGEPERKTLTVIMFDTKGNRKRDWTFNRAFPVKWQGPALKANGNEIAIETVEFAHEGLLRI